MIVCLLLLNVLTDADMPKVSCLDSFKVLDLLPCVVLSFGLACFIGFLVLSRHVVLLDFFEQGLVIGFSLYQWDLVHKCF